MRDLSSLTRDPTHVSPATGAWSLNEWTAREVPQTCLMDSVLRHKVVVFF